MEWALLVDLLKGIAWPVVVYLLGRQAVPMLKGVVERIKTLKAGDKSIELSELPAAPTTSQLPAPQPEQKQLPPPTPNQPPQLVEPPPAPSTDLVSFDAAAAVIYAWSILEDTMRREAIRLEYLGAQEAHVSAGSVANRLFQRNLITEQTLERIQELRRIRNEVAHAKRTITQPAAEAFIEIAATAIRDIEAYADINQLRRVFEQLGVDVVDLEQVRSVRVGRLSATGVSADPKAASEMARRRAEMWAARFKGKIMLVSERDAALLIARGATQADPEALDSLD